MSRIIAAVLVSMLALGASVFAQDWMQPVSTPRTIVLWPDGAPGALGKEDADIPTLTIYLPARRRPPARPSSSVPAAGTARSRWITRATRSRGS